MTPGWDQRLFGNKFFDFTDNNLDLISCQVREHGQGKNFSGHFLSYWIVSVSLISFRVSLLEVEGDGIVKPGADSVFREEPLEFFRPRVRMT